MGILISEAYADATRHCFCGESDVFESCFNTPSEVYRGCLKEYGRCVMKHPTNMRILATLSNVCFAKRRKYEDCSETYLAETWIELHTAQPTKTITKHYLELS